MHKTRVEAFSDGVIAIIMTIMVLEFKTPRGDTWACLEPIAPQLLSYVYSFLFVGIYWMNHHALLHASQKVSQGVLWANLHFIFWLSLIPFVTGWMNEAHYSKESVVTYGAVLLMCEIGFHMLRASLVGVHGPGSSVARAVGRDLKAWASIALYTAACSLAFIDTSYSLGVYLFIAMLWVKPSVRFESL